MEHAWQWGQERNGGRKSMERWVGLMWPRELPERKMGKRGGGTLMAASGCQHLRKMGLAWYICQTARVCVCVSVHMCDRVSHSLYLPQPNTSHPCSLHSSPIHIHPSLSFHSTPLPPFLPPPPPLFTLTVIWQAQGWQTWSWQGKRLSGPALLGSCWLAEEPTVRSGRCDWPRDWREGRRRSGGKGLGGCSRVVGWDRRPSGESPEGVSARSRKTQPELNPIFATSLDTTLQFGRSETAVRPQPSRKYLSHQSSNRRSPCQVFLFASNSDHNIWAKQIAQIPSNQA